MQKPKHIQRGKLVPILLVVIAIVGYLIYSKQQEQKEQAAARALAQTQITEINKLVERWDDAMKIAMATSRITLSGQSCIAPSRNSHSYSRRADSLTTERRADKRFSNLLGSDPDLRNRDS